MIEQFVQEFAKEMGMPESSFASTSVGVYVIPLEQDLSVTIKTLPQGFELSSVLAPCPKDRLEAFLTQALLGNLFGQGTHGGVLGVSEDGNLLTLSKPVEYTVNYREFKDLLEDFINTADYWKEEALQNQHE